MSHPTARADLSIEWFDDAALVLGGGRVTRLDLASAAFLVALDGTDGGPMRSELVAALGVDADTWIDDRLELFRRLDLLATPPP